MWKISRPQIFFGQTIAWGQYVIAILVTLFILIPFFNSHEIAGTLIEMSFQGGMGVAAGLKSTFNDLGFSTAYDISVGLSTFGII